MEIVKITIPDEWTAYQPKFNQNPDFAWLEENGSKITPQEFAEHARSVIEDWRLTTRANSAMRLMRAVAEIDYQPEQNWLQTTTGYLDAVADSMRSMAKNPQNHFEDEDGEPLSAEECLHLAVDYIVGSMRDAHEDWKYLSGK